MLENIRNLLERATVYLGELSLPKKIAVGALGLAVVGALITFTLVGGARKDSLLYGDLSTQDFQAITKKLGELNIAYRFPRDQTAIYVPTQQLDQARMELAKEGLPGKSVVGFERFDNSTFGMSSYVQRIQYLRAIQGELTRSIERISQVKRARVHISIPPKKTFLEEEQPAKASVIVEMHSGEKLSKKEVKGIAHLVSSAVEALDASKVTIVDNEGKFLHRPEHEGEDGILTGMIEIQRSIESTYERRIVDLLAPIVGDQKVIAKVTAEMDTSQVNTTEESYDPDNAVALSSAKDDETSNGSRPNPIGIPGSRSNLPGSEVTNPPVPMATSNTTRNINNTNFAVPRKIQTVNKPSGNIKRLTVAVVVDGYYNSSGTGAQEVFTPRSEEELRRLQEVVANAVGYDPQRRDSITVSSLPFEKSDLAFPSDQQAPSQIGGVMGDLVTNGIIAVFILLVFFLIVRPFLKWAAIGDVRKEFDELPRTVAQLEQARGNPELIALANAMDSDDAQQPFEKRENEELKEKISEYLEKTPKKAFQILEEWMTQEPLKVKA